MKSIESYKITWNVKSDEGIILLQTEEGVEQLLADSAAEAMLLLDILRNESPVFYNDGLLFTGFEPVGEGEGGSKNESGDKKKSKKKKKKMLTISY
jgi:hypothetical protein